MSAGGWRERRAAASGRRAILVLIALATAVALVWLLGRTVDLSHTASSDSQLAADVQVARATLADDVAVAARRAAALARLTRTRDALANNDAAALSALARVHPGSMLISARGARGGSLSPLGVRRVADVVENGKRIGRVVTETRLDSGYLMRVEAALPAGVQDRVIVTNGGKVAAGSLPAGAELESGPVGNVRVAGHDYRAVSAPLAGDRPGVRIVALTARTGGFLPSWRLPLAVLATLAALFLATAWLAAPLRDRAHGPSRRAETPRGRQRLPGGVALLGETLAATHDEEALLEVIRDAAIEATGAAAGRVVRSNEAGSTGPELDGTLTVSLETSESDGSSIVLLPPPGGFGQDAAAVAEWLGIQGSTALRNAHSHRVAELHALTDDLTGLANRRRFTATLHAELARAERFGTALAVLLADLDGFKLINDHFGHVAGDEVLKTFARAIEGSIREIDLASRFGGDEFAVLLTQTDADGARQVAERLRTELRVAQALPARVTASYGISSFPQAPANELLQVADACLYRAKRAGGDMVEFEGGAPGSPVST